MNRLVRGSIMFVAAAGAWACKTNLGENADVTDHLSATPTVVQIANTDSQAVDVEALNPLGEQLATTFSIANVGAGLVVRQDTSFLPVPGGHSPTRARFVVRGIDLSTFVNSSFTIAAGGKSVTIQVFIFPATLVGGAISNANPAIGDTVQITAPAGVRFTSATTITTPADTSRRLANVGISADSTILFVLPGPDIANRVLTLGNVQVTYQPGLNYTIPTDVSITTGPLPAPLPTISGVSNATPALLDTVAITAPAPFGFTANSRVTLACTGAGCVAAPNAFVDVSVDHSTLRFVIGGGVGAGGIFTASNVALGGQASLGVMTLSSTAILTAPPLPSPLPPVTVSNATPALGDTVTVTAPANFGFQSTSRVTLGGGATAIHVDVSADGTTLRFVIGPNSTGPLSVSNVKLGSNVNLNTVTLTSGGVNVVSPPAPAFTAVFSNTTPAGGEQVQMTAPAAYRLRPSAVTVSVGGILTLIDSVSVDSTTVWFTPRPGTSGAPSVTNVILTFLPTVPLTVSATSSLTVGGALFVGTNALATAPILTLAASGSQVEYFDAGTFSGTSLAGFGANFPTRYYKVVVATATVIDLDINWNNNDDLGLYVFDATACGATACDVAAIVDAADNAGSGATGHPEIQTGVTLAPGTYFFGMVEFGPAAGPPVYRMRFSTQ